MKPRQNQILSHCFEPKKGKRPELLKTRPSLNKAKAHLEKAHHNLKAMLLMSQYEFNDWTIICGYYAMYHAVLASLHHIGIAAFSHTCAISAFQKFFIERGRVGEKYLEYINRANKLERRYSISLNEARENRVKIQYGAQLFGNTEIEWILDEAEEFVLRIEEFLTE